MASTSNTDFWLSLAIFLDVTDSEISALLTEKSLKAGVAKIGLFLTVEQICNN